MIDLLTMKYDYLIVGSGLFGSIFAYEASKRGHKVLVIDKRQQVGGNLYNRISNDGVAVHTYGAHIFHTSSKKIWDYVNEATTFIPFINSPIVSYQDKLFNLPFNMNTFYQLWQVKTPEQAKAKLSEQTSKYSHITQPKNLEEQALKLVGDDIYRIFIKDYTEKQWGRSCNKLPSFIINRLPIRLTFDNNYFKDIYQGIPKNSYNDLFDYWLKNIDVELNSDFFIKRDYYESLARKIVYTGSIDSFFDYSLGQLNYRSVYFEEKELKTDNYQGNAVFNYTHKDVPYTRIIEHKHFNAFSSSPNTIISYEYSQEWNLDKEPYYPINDDINNALYAKYKALADTKHNVIFGGRLAEYKYYDMDKTIEQVLNAVNKEFQS